MRSAEMHSAEMESPPMESAEIENGWAGIGLAGNGMEWAEAENDRAEMIEIEDAMDSRSGSKQGAPSVASSAVATIEDEAALCRRRSQIKHH